MSKITITGYLTTPEKTPEGNLKEVKKSITVRTKIGFKIALRFIMFFFDYVEITPISEVVKMFGKKVE